MSETKLYIYKSQNLSLADAIGAFLKAFSNESEEHFALLYGPRQCHLALVNAKGAATDAGNDVPLHDVFEARVFNMRAELRWLNDPDGGSDAAIVTEGDSFTFDGFTLESEEPIVGKVETFPALKSDKSGRQTEEEKEIQHGYLLWGEGTGESRHGWSEMATARIGAYYVPIAGVGRGDRVRLTAVEYLKKYDHGNVGVCEERLIGLSKVEAPQAKKGVAK